MSGGMMTVTEGAVALKPIMEPTANGSLVAAHVYFNGVDLLRIEGARIAGLGVLGGPTGRGRMLGQCLRGGSAET
jgi:hypothetical protein